MDSESPKLRLRPIALREANNYVRRIHRHHGPTQGHKFSIAVEDEQGVVRGVLIAGRPQSRLLDNGRRLEILRLATDGAENACSMLYSAATRAAVAMGYKREDVLTYILETEHGSSLRASGWVKVAETKGDTWNRPNRERADDHPTGPKSRWHAAMPPTLTLTR